jgi:hypothetical protein
MVLWFSIEVHLVPRVPLAVAVAAQPIHGERLIVVFVMTLDSSGLFTFLAALWFQYDACFDGSFESPVCCLSLPVVRLCMCHDSL